MNVYNINGFFWRSICIPEAYRGYAIPFILNVSVKIVYIYFFMLSCKGFLQMEVSIFQLPHLLWSHNSVLACWMGHASHKIVFGVYFSMYSFVRLKNAVLVRFFSKWLRLTTWVLFACKFNYATWICSMHKYVYFFPFSINYELCYMSPFGGLYGTWISFEVYRIFSSVLMFARTQGLAIQLVYVITICAWRTPCGTTVQYAMRCVLCVLYLCI